MVYWVTDLLVYLVAVKFFTRLLAEAGSLVNRPAASLINFQCTRRTHPRTAEIYLGGF